MSVKTSLRIKKKSKVDSYNRPYLTAILKNSEFNSYKHWARTISLNHFKIKKIVKKIVKLTGYAKLDHIIGAF